MKYVYNKWFFCFIQISSMILINALICNAENVDFKIHLRSDFARCGLITAIEVYLLFTVLKEMKLFNWIFFKRHWNQSQENLNMMIRWWSRSLYLKIILMIILKRLILKLKTLKEFGMVNFSHFQIILNIDLIKVVWFVDTKGCFEYVYNTISGTPAEFCLLSILQHLLLVRDDTQIRYSYYRLVEECVAKIVLHRDGRDPDFECGSKFDLDVDSMLSKYNIK